MLAFFFNYKGELSVQASIYLRTMTVLVNPNIIIEIALAQLEAVSKQLKLDEDMPKVGEATAPPPPPLKNYSPEMRLI